MYSEVHRSSMERLLIEPTRRHWNGHLVVGRDVALIFANLDTIRWKFESPAQLRMELRGGLNPSSRVRYATVPQLVTDNAAIRAEARRRWRPYRPNVPAHAFALHSGGRRYVYLGTTRPGPYGGWGSNAFGRHAHMDCRIRPPVPFLVWKELRSHRLEIDGQVIDRVSIASHYRCGTWVRSSSSSGTVDGWTRRYSVADSVRSVIRKMAESGSCVIKANTGARTRRARRGSRGRRTPYCWCGRMASSHLGSIGFEPAGYP